VAKCSFSELWPLYLVLTLLFCEMLDVARYVPYGGKLSCLCQGWLVASIRTKQNQRYDRHLIGNSPVKHTLRIDG